MKNFLRALILLFVTLPAFSQTKLSLYPSPPSSAPEQVPAGTRATITAIVNGSTNHAVTWTTTGGNLVGLTNCPNTGAACTIALTSPIAGGPYTVTATSGDGTVTHTASVQFTPSPVPVTTNPRFLITQASLPSLQAKAVAGNPLYQAIKNEALSLYSTDDAIWSWSCNSGTGQPNSDQTGASKEIDAWYFAYMSLMEPNDSTHHWGCAGRDTILYAMAHVQDGSQYFAGNDWSDNGIYYAVAPDWLIGSGAISTTADKNAVRAFFGWAAPTILNYGYGVSAPYNNLNAVGQFDTNRTEDQEDERAFGNNYTMTRLLWIVAISQTFNDNTTDDPPLTNTCGATRYQICPDYTAGSLHAYYNYFAGGLLLKMNAHLEDPNVTQQEYNTAYPSGGFSTIPTCRFTDGTKYTCFGDGRGGESSEGSWYQYSVYRLRYALNMMHTAGLDDPLIYGPQISLEASSWWDLKMVADAEFLTGFGANGNSASPGYGYFTTGDTNNYVRKPNDFTTEGAMLGWNIYSGRTDNNNDLLWLIENSAHGGPRGTDGGCTAYCGLISELSNTFAGDIALDLFLYLPPTDPTSGTLPTDPRPNYPTDWWNDSYNQHQLLRKDWTPSSPAVSIYGQTSMINHEHQYQGGFDIYQNGEYITKGRTEFNDYNDLMSTPMFRNGASYVNLSAGANTNGCSNQFAPAAAGGQFFQGQQQGIGNNALHSETSDHASFIQNTTVAYNGCYVYNEPYDTVAYNDITAASRSIVYIRGTNQMVYYDRGDSAHAASKTVWLNTTGNPTVSGNKATWLTRSGTQKAALTTLLPAGGTLSKLPLVNETMVSAPFTNLQVGTTEQATCTATYADGTTADVTSTASWSVDNSTATVSSTGLVTAVTAGDPTYLRCGSSDIGSYGLLTVVSTASSGSFSGNADTDMLDDFEPYAQLKIDAGAPTSARFLTTLEWGASTLTPTTATLVQSTAGQNFDGTKLGTSLVMFMRTSAAFTGVTYPASGATTHYISDLSPNTSYALSGTGTPTSATTDSAGVLTFTSAGTGSITVGAGSPPPPPPPPPPPSTSHVTQFSGKVSGSVIFY